MGQGLRLATIGVQGVMPDDMWCKAWSHVGKTHPRIENQMHNDMETRCVQRFTGIRVSKNLLQGLGFPKIWSPFWSPCSTAYSTLGSTETQFGLQRLYSEASEECLVKGSV